MGPYTSKGQGRERIEEGKGEKKGRGREREGPAPFSQIPVYAPAKSLYITCALCEQWHYCITCCKLYMHMMVNVSLCL